MVCLSDFTNYIHDKQEEVPYTMSTAQKVEPPAEMSAISFNDLMALIRNHVLVNGIRVSVHTIQI